MRPSLYPGLPPPCSGAAYFPVVCQTFYTTSYTRYFLVNNGKPGPNPAPAQLVKALEKPPLSLREQERYFQGYNLSYVTRLLDLPSPYPLFDPDQPDDHLVLILKSFDRLIEQAHVAYLTTFFMEHLAAQNPGKLSLIHYYPGLVLSEAFQDPTFPFWFRAIFKYGKPLINLFPITLKGEESGQRTLFSASPRFPARSADGKAASMAGAGEIGVAESSDGIMGGGAYRVTYNNETYMLPSNEKYLAEVGMAECTAIPNCSIWRIDGAIWMSMMSVARQAGPDGELLGDLRCSEMTQSHAVANGTGSSTISTIVRPLDNLLIAHEPYEALQIQANHSENGDEEGEEKDEAKEMFEIGIRHLIGLGVEKDIPRGFRHLISAADLESADAKALVSSLAATYNIDLDLSDDVLETWLVEASKSGSGISLRELRSRFFSKFREVCDNSQLVLSPRNTEAPNFNAAEDLLPFFSMHDPDALARQLDSERDKLLAASCEGEMTAASSRSIRLLYAIKNLSGGAYVYGSLLHLAAFFGFHDAILVLLDRGFDIDAENCDERHQTPLLSALSRGHVTTARILIERGAGCLPGTEWKADCQESYSEKVSSSCSEPSALHHLVNIAEDSEAIELARLIVNRGGDVNRKCDVIYLTSTQTDFSVLQGRSTTPLRWAMVNGKWALAEQLLKLGAKFASENMSRITGKPGLLLETPCTNIEILKSFFSQAQRSGLPSEFSRTPLGLLVSEDDGPERRLRFGFENDGKVMGALKLLLNLQPGYDNLVLWSAVRHGHLYITRYLIETAGWSVNSRWKGMTYLHTAVLYGRVDFVEYLLSQGADGASRTTRRGLTCLHILALVPRDPKTDHQILQWLLRLGIDVNVKEKVDSLTAFHLAVRNKKLQMAKQLLQVGADPLIQVSDQLHILNGGKGGYLKTDLGQPKLFHERVSILGEVVIQYIQDGFYDKDYVVSLLDAFFEWKQGNVSSEDIVIDRENGISLLHLLAVTGHSKLEPWNERLPGSPREVPAERSLLSMFLEKISPQLINVTDLQGDSPLHYACAAGRAENIDILLSHGADLGLRNRLGLTAVETLAWSVILLGRKKWFFCQPNQCWHPDVRLRKERLDDDTYKLKDDLTHKRATHHDNELSSAFAKFAELGFTVNERLQRLVLAWDFAKWPMPDLQHSWYPYNSNLDNYKHFFELVPEKSTKNLGDVEINASNKYWYQCFLKRPRPYIRVTLTPLVRERSDKRGLGSMAKWIRK
ncbi:hypothetical protein G7Y89_g86 [Cudoniella acicularis]|uniref:Uncharacterized protein n=1 Tax=Cudoniella acicularis TaxID=354080 RepID=A0A8H4RXX3_9HELO|nr:hypothetical protein G7Y89_g86 [Cudoniella acicularis]